MTFIHACPSDTNVYLFRIFLNVLGGGGLFTFRFTPNLIHEQCKVILKQDNNFQTHRIGNRATCDSREEKANYQRHKFGLKNRELSFYSHKITRRIVHFSCQCLSIKTLIKTCISDSALFIIQSFSTSLWFVYLRMTSCKNSIRISFKMIFVNKH